MKNDGPCNSDNPVGSETGKRGWQPPFRQDVICIHARHELIARRPVAGAPRPHNSFLLATDHPGAVSLCQLCSAIRREIIDDDDFKVAGDPFCFTLDRLNAGSNVLFFVKTWHHK